VRHGQAEAWPGPWDADHVKITFSGMDIRKRAKAA
jgi:hypothetical protein